MNASVKSFSPLRLTLALLATVVLGAIIVWRAVDLGLVADRGSDRVMLMVLPVCISNLYHGKRADYTAYREVRTIADHYRYTVFKKPYHGGSDRAVQAMKGATVLRPNAIMYWGYDDRGLADFCRIAFTLFGASIASFSMLWLSIFLLSATVFLLAFVRCRAGPPVLWFFLFSAFLGLGLYSFMLTATTLHEERGFEYLSFLPALHIALSPHLARRADPIVVAALAVQVLIFVFVYHARSSIGWQLLPIIGSALIAIIRERANIPALWRRNAPGRQKAMLAVLPLAAMASGLLALVVYMQVAYHPAYFGEQGGRSFYHNALMGLHGLKIDGERRMSIDDKKTKDAVRAFVARRDGGRIEDVQYEAQFGRAYERDARAYYYYLLRNNFAKIVGYYAFRKTRSSLDTLFTRTVFFDRPYGQVRVGDEMRSMAEPGVMDYVRAQGLLFSPLGWGSALLILLAAFYSKGERRGLATATAVAAMFLAASLIPSVLFYNQDMRQLTGTALSVGLLAHLLVYWIVMLVIGVGRKRLAFAYPRAPGTRETHSSGGSSAAQRLLSWLPGSAGALVHRGWGLTRPPHSSHSDSRSPDNAPGNNAHGAALAQRENQTMRYSQWASFLVKSLIVSILVAVVGLFLLNAAADRVEDTMRRVVREALPTGMLPGQGKLGAATQRLAQSLKEMSPERRKELIAALRTIATELEPFAAELRPLLSGPSSNQRAAPKSQ